MGKLVHLKITLRLVFAFLLCSFASKAQHVVQGTVTSLSEKTTLPGVSVLIKGTTNGTTTDVDGHYSLQVAENDVLVFSFIGYQTEEVVILKQTTVDIYMSPSLQELMEVVVVGYSEKKKQEITGAVTTVSAEQLKGVTGSNVEYMLQGKAAGVQVTSATGAPGAPAEIRIRGNSSISSDSPPLFVVDGIIGGTYNPNDVESLTVLKDAGAIALYGSRANNGVIIVTTKHGTSEKPQITYKTTYGNRNITTGKFQMMNSQELYDTERTMFNSSAQFNILRPASVLDTNTDWVKLAYKTGVIQNHNLSMRGKSGKISYYLAGDYYNEHGTLLSTQYKRYNFRSNLDFELTKNIKLTTNLTMISDNNNSYHWRWPYQPFLYLPYDSPYDADGNIRYVDGTTPGFLTRDKNNILQSAMYNDYRSRGFNMNGDVILTATVRPWLTLQTRNRISYSNYRSDNYEDSKTIEGAANNGVLSFGTSYGYSIISTNLIRLNRDFGAHHVGGFVGFEGQEWTSEDANGGGYGIVSGIKIPGAVASPQSITGGKSEARAMSILSEVNYDYQDKYFLSGSFRRDGSSKFGTNRRWGNFGAVSGSWIISKEGFFTPLNSTVTFMKLRGSYGIVGNDAIPLFQYLAKFDFSHQYNGGSAGYPTTISNQGLSWEQTKTGDIGLETTLFNRIDVAIDAFNKDNDRLLLSVPLAPSQGIDHVYRNVGRVVNHGYEFSISGDVVKKSDLRWNVAFNIGSAQNRVKSLAPGLGAVPRTYDGTKQMIQPGHDMNSFYLPKWAGVNPDNGDPQWEKAVLDGDGKVTGYEKTNSYSDASSLQSLQFVGAATPKFFGGLTTTVSYKRFTLSVSSAYQYGNKIYHRTREFVDADGALFNFNMMKLQDGWSRWQNPGDNATHPKPMYGGNLQSNKSSSRYLEDGSYLRIRNINLNYAIPTSVLSKAKIQSANIFLSADNLFTFTKFSGLDPEVPSFGNIRGISDFKYPISKQYLMGLQITF